MKILFRLLAAALLWTSMAAAATPPRRDMVAEAKIEHDLSKLNPALLEPFRQARIALDAADYAKAAELLEPVVQQAPAFDPALRRYGGSLVAMGKRADGLVWLERAVAIDRSAANLGSLAYALVSSDKGDVSSSERARAKLLAVAATEKPDGQDLSTLSLAAQLSFQMQDQATARSLTAKLGEKFPDEMVTHYCQAVIAAVDERWTTAAREIHAAEKRGLDAETVQRFLDSGVGTRAAVWRWVGILAWAIGIWAAGLTVLCGLGFALSKATLRQIARSDPTVAITPGEHGLRRLYRAVVNMAGMYYYVSLPVIVVLVILVAAGVIGAFFAIGFLPIKLMIILGIGAIATIVSMVRSLFLRVEAKDPGRPVTREEAPGLWRVSEDVAATLGTRPVEEIRVTPGTDLCVYERGSWREKMNDQATRVLVLGAAVLQDFKQDDFRCVLAHEYGHFSHRDTAGGEVALRVRNDIMKFYLTMLAAGQATWLNVAFHFLRAYNFVFRRISHGATRLQEVLADRVAAQAYGAPAFEGGLRHVIRRSIEFDEQADTEIRAAIAAKRPIQNLYEPHVTESTTVAQKYEETINRPTTEDDTHPGPLDRFRLISRIPAPAVTSAPGTVWDLFADREAITKAMTEEVEKNIARHRT